MTESNAVWTTDFKGQFRTTDARLCYPLTVCDAWSRFFVRCHALPSPTTAGTIAVFQRAFREYGLPARIRSDNGEPFAAARRRRISSPSREWDLHFGPIRLGRFDERTRRIEPAGRRRR